jgi:H+/Cl- antiporter ClcA
MKNSLYSGLSLLLSILLIGSIVGSLAAFFLVALEFVTNERESSLWWVYFLPVGGAVIGFTYYYLEKNVEGGNNLLIKEMIIPKNRIHWKLTPLVLFGTLATHLFGGSAGREGTAVQMGGTTADQFNGLFNLPEIERKLLLRMGVAAGFAGIFGTPIAGIFFALELGRDNKFHFIWIPPLVLVSFFADFICHVWNVHHTTYSITNFTEFDIQSISMVFVAGVIFGLCALFFNLTKITLTKWFIRFIAYPPLRPIIGGAVLLIIVLLLNTTKYLGLGVPIIEDAFVNSASSEVFLIKLLLTAFTLAAGFKGGEATPLFFMGATLGSFLIIVLPLPISLLAGLGFIAVFAGATNTPIACTLMGCELFGYEGIVYYAIVCFTAYLITGKTSVYASQQEYLKKISFLERYRTKQVND